MEKRTLPRKWLIIALVIIILLFSTGAFIYYQWNATYMTWEMDHDMEHDISDRLGKGEILSFNSRMELQRGKTMEYYFIIKNKESEERNFGFVIRCNQTEKQMNDTLCDSTIHGGLGAETEWFSLSPTVKLNTTEVKAVPMAVHILAENNTFEYSLEVYVGSADGSEPIVDSEHLYASRTFYVVVE